MVKNFFSTYYSVFVCSKVLRFRNPRPERRFLLNLLMTLNDSFFINDS